MVVTGILSNTWSRKRKRTSVKSLRFDDGVNEVYLFDNTEPVVAPMQKQDISKALFTIPSKKHDMRAIEEGRKRVAFGTNSVVNREIVVENAPPGVEIKEDPATKRRYFEEFFCDNCHESIPFGTMRHECRTCPDNFCLCAQCFRSIGSHPHDLVANLAYVHVTS